MSVEVKRETPENDRDIPETPDDWTMPNRKTTSTKRKTRVKDFTLTTDGRETTFTTEQKIVSAVWVHERVKCNMSWERILKNFRLRFGTEPPNKRTLCRWEQKLFVTGSVRDNDRNGRPCARLMHVPYVKQSLCEAPNMSLRERACELGLPRSTLLKILKDDLQMIFVPDSPFLKTNSSIATQTGVWQFKG